MGFSQILIELQDMMGDDRRIAESAWTSSTVKAKKELRTDEDVAKVIAMLGGSKPAHGVPFESVVFHFWYRFPIFTDRQYVTHRIQSVNGMSARYRTMPSDFYSIPEDVLAIMTKADLLYYEQAYNAVCTKANIAYKDSVEAFRAKLKAGIITEAEFKRVREIMRGCLPQANMTERTATINLRSFANFQKQRNDSHAQPEIMYLAQEMLKAVEESGKLPVTLKILKANNWVI